MYKPYGNHKIKSYSRYTKDKKKLIKVYHYRKSRNCKETELERKKWTREKAKQPENSQKDSIKPIAINNYFKLIKFSNQKISRVAEWIKKTKDPSYDTYERYSSSLSTHRG